MASVLTINRRNIAGNGKFDYLDDADRYYSQRIQPILKFAIVGTGMMGQEHAKVTVLEGRAQVVGIYDTSQSSIDAMQRILVERYGKEVKVYRDMQEVCKDPETDAILVCTPNFSHLEVLKQLIPSHKHLFLEKPMATSLHDAWEILSIQRTYDRILQVGLQYRYKPQYVEAYRRVIGEKALGSVSMIYITERRIPFLDKVGQWNKFSRYSGGTLVEKCCHYFDLFNYFAQARPVQVYATGSQAVDFLDFDRQGTASDILDNAFVVVEYENGIRACFQLCMFAPLFYEELVVSGDKGQIKCWEKQEFLYHRDIDTGLEMHRGEYGPSEIASPRYPMVIGQSGHCGATFFEHTYFVDNILGQTTTTATAEEGFWSVVVGVAAEMSVKTKKPVDIGELLKHQGIVPQ